jgi:hypothetical protein
MKKFLIILVLLPFSLLSQKLENVPYTRYGLGEILSSNNAAYSAMGYSSIANVDRYHFNLSNSAQLGMLRTTAFEVGANAKKTTQKEGANSASSWSGNLDYVAIGFPMKNPLNEVYETKKQKYHWGMGFSLGRNSRTSYSINSDDTTTANLKYLKNYQGEGGTYKFSWKNGVSYKNISVGLDVNYIFGSISNSRSIEFYEQVSSYNSYFDRSFSVSGFGVQLGGLYNLKLNEKANIDNPSIPLKQLFFGLTINPGSRMSTSKDEFSYNRQDLVGAPSLVDTISNVLDVSGKGKLPSEIGAAVMYQIGESSAFTLEYKISGWNKYFNEGNGDQAGSLNNGSHISFGGYYRPDYKSYTSLWKRSMFKYGLYYDKDPRVVLEKEITSYGATFGIGIPFIFQRKLSHTDISVDLGLRGKGSIIEEKYMKINFGFTFNDDEWFIKRKYN